jgi:PEP-CTERM motif
MLKKRFFVLLLVVSVLSGLSQAVPTNGDFSSGLDGWTSSGFVSNVGGQALFVENPSGDRMSSLSQDFFLPADAKELSFKLTMSSSGGGSPDSDTFTASLLDYTTLAPLISSPGYTNFYLLNDDPTQITIASVVDDSDGGKLVTLDVSSLVGRHVLLNFGLYSDPLDSLNTTVSLDNVNVSTAVVPVPSAMLLSGIGVAAISWFRRRNMM